MNVPQQNAFTPVVYLIDDNPNDVLIIRRLCESVGLSVISFSSPQSFLSELEPGQHGCIVADLMMPEMTGLQLHNELQNAGSEMPIIVITGHADARTCRRALHSGVYDFVEKSFDPHDLLVVIQEAIEANEKRKQERTYRDSCLQQLDVLSPREREVMEVLANGATLKEIAAKFKISVQTASKHRSSLFDKLQISNEVELLKLLIRVDPNQALHRPAAEANAPPAPAVTSAPEFLGPGPAAAAGNG